MNCNNENNNERSYYNSNISIENCIFVRSLLFSGNGAVIYVSDNYNYYNIMNIISSTFYNCTCSVFGGAIWFRSLRSVLNMVCAFKCESKEFQFAYLMATEINELIFLSISSCSKNISNRLSLLLYNGKQRYDNTNSSLNKASEISSINIINPLEFSSSFCTFANNEVSDSICLYFQGVSNSMFCSNIVHNNSPKRYGVIRGYTGFPKMISCVFAMNSDVLFWVTSGQFEIANCYISHCSIFSEYSAVTTINNNSFTKIHTLVIQFYNTLYCNTDPITLIDTPLFTNIETHSITFQETPSITNEETHSSIPSINNNSVLWDLRVVVILISILFISFISIVLFKIWSAHKEISSSNISTKHIEQPFL